MREIKFRGKSKTAGEWIYGDITRNEKGAIAVTPVWEKMRRERKYPGAYEVDPATLGQFTGLKDRNGNDIFEGDIVSNEKYVGRVKWMPGKCCYQISPGGVYLSKSCEVLGNIYDNPELLEGGEQ